MKSLILRKLAIADENSFRYAVESFKTENSGFNFAFDYNAEEDFEKYLERVEGWSRGEGLKDGFVPNSFYVGVVNDNIVGRLSLRHKLNDFLREVGGHIGYGVITSERNKGYASEMLRQGIAIAKGMGINEVLITCDVDNIGSRKVIENNFGKYHSTTELDHLEKQKHLFWVDTNVHEQID